jgi:hypothetical protein
MGTDCPVVSKVISPYMVRAVPSHVATATTCPLIAPARALSECPNDHDLRAQLGFRAVATLEAITHEPQTKMSAQPPGAHMPVSSVAQAYTQLLMGSPAMAALPCARGQSRHDEMGKTADPTSTPMRR